MLSDVGWYGTISYPIGQSHWTITGCCRWPLPLRISINIEKTTLSHMMTMVEAVIHLVALIDAMSEQQLIRYLLY